MRLLSIREIIAKFIRVKIFQTGTSRVITIPKAIRELLKATGFQLAYLTKSEALEYINHIHDDDRGILIAIPIFPEDEDSGDQ